MAVSTILVVIFCLFAFFFFRFRETQRQFKDRMKRLEILNSAMNCSYVELGDIYLRNFPDQDVLVLNGENPETENNAKNSFGHFLVLAILDNDNLYIPMMKLLGKHGNLEGALTSNSSAKEVVDILRTAKEYAQKTTRNWTRM